MPASARSSRGRDRRVASFFLGWRLPGPESRDEAVIENGADGADGAAAVDITPSTPTSAGTVADPTEEAAERPLPALGDAPPPLSAGDSLATAGRKAMWTHLNRMLARERSIGDPEKPDELRKYRVAIRRLRAAARMFVDAYPDREIRPIRRRLSDLADAVGTVRDIDLRIANLSTWSRERGAGATGPSLRSSRPGADERRRAIAALLEEVGSRRHHRLLNRLVDFVEARPLTDRRGGFTGPSTIGDRLASMIWAAYEDVRSYAAVIRWADLETMHQLRISTKRLRDDLEFLGELIGPDRALLLERLVALQDQLGAMNDAAVTAQAVRVFLEERHGQLTPAQGGEIVTYLADREREAARLQRSSVGPWRAVTGLAFARRLARVVVVPAGTPVAPGRRPARPRRPPPAVEPPAPGSEGAAS